MKKISRTLTARRRSSWRSLQADDLRSDREINLVAGDGNNGARRAVPLVDQPVGLASCLRPFVAALVLPAEIRGAIEAAIAIALAEKVGDQAGLEVERAEIALVGAEQLLRGARERL